MNQYASAEETASVMRQATPDETWLHAQLDRIDPHRHEMGSAGDTPALVKLVFELRDKLAATPAPKICKHEHTHVDWDHVQCKACGAVKLDGAGKGWHASLAHARRFKDGF
jgi:hypothetical protein